MWAIKWHGSSVTRRDDWKSFVIISRRRENVGREFYGATPTTTPRSSTIATSYLTSLSLFTDIKPLLGAEFVVSNSRKPSGFSTHPERKALLVWSSHNCCGNCKVAIFNASAIKAAHKQESYEAEVANNGNEPTYKSCLFV